MRAIGIVDSVMYRDTLSFKHFERTDGVHIVEINPRMCAQFADLMESVNGVNTYEVLVAVAAGRARFSVATSFVFRHFTDATVAAVPDAARIDAIKATLPVTLPSTSDIDYEFDGYSYRYAVVNMAGADEASLECDLAAALEFRLETIAPDASA